MPLPVTVLTGGGLQIDGARVIRADIIATNGVLHVIERVMIPPGALMETGVARSCPGSSGLTMKIDIFSAPFRPTYDRRELLRSLYTCDAHRVRHGTAGYHGTLRAGSRPLS